MTIPLGALLPRRLKLPTRTAGLKRPHMRSLFGIAPGGACHATPVAGGAVGSYPTVSPSPREARRSDLCGAFRRIAPPGHYPAPLLQGVRTFLEPIGPRPSSLPRRPDLCAGRRRVKRWRGRWRWHNRWSRAVPWHPVGTSTGRRGAAVRRPHQDSQTKSLPRETSPCPVDPVAPSSLWAKPRAPVWPNAANQNVAPDPVCGPAPYPSVRSRQRAECPIVAECREGGCPMRP